MIQIIVGWTIEIIEDEWLKLLWDERLRLSIRFIEDEWWRWMMKMND